MNLSDWHPPELTCPDGILQTPVDARGADWRGQTLPGIDLRGANLCRSDLRGTDLSSCPMDNADLRLALYDSNTRVPDDIDLRSSGAVGPGAKLSGTFLNNTDLRGMDLRGAVLMGAYLSGADNIALGPVNPIGTGDFTYEMWFYGTNLQTERGFLQLTNSTSGINAGYDGFAIYTKDYSAGSVNIRFFDVNSNLVSTSGRPVSENTWHHLAVSRQNGTVRIFIDGTQEASGTVTTDFDEEYLGLGAYILLMIVAMTTVCKATLMTLEFHQLPFTQLPLMCQHLN